MDYKKPLFFLLFLCLFQPLGAEVKNIYLATVGPGDRLYTRFGHTGIVLQGEEESFFYDFGNFDFSSEGFYRNFALGRMYYLKYRTPTVLYFTQLAWEKRNLVLQRLNFSQEEIDILWESLERNVQPGNNTFLYDYYLDNCATLPRDILNQAVGGALRRATHYEKRGESYRSLYRKYLGGTLWADLLLDVIQGKGVDRGIDNWEAMFLPDELMRQVAALKVETERGEEPFVLETIPVLKSPKGKPLERAPALGGPPLLLGLVLGCWFLFSQVLALKRGLSRKLGLLFFSLPMGVFFLFSLVFYWFVFVTNHTVGDWNLNIFLIHPLYILTMVYLFRGEASKLRHFWKFQGLLWLLTAGVNLFFGQDNLRTALFTLGILLPPLLAQVYTVFFQSRQGKGGIFKTLRIR